MTFNPLKRILKSTLNRDPIEQIFWGNPTADTYTKVLYNYRSMNSQYRQDVIDRCLKKLTKPKQFDLALANLVLIHKLMKIDYMLLPGKQPEIQPISKKKEVNVAQKSFIKFYFNFIKLQQNKTKMSSSKMQQKIQYCELSLKNCTQIMKNNIVIQYCLNHCTNQLTLRMAMKQIFDQLRADLQFTTNFIQANAKLIYEQNNDISFMINEVYENLLYVNRNLSKITVLAKKSGLGMNFPTYQMNKDLNMKIQMEMNSRKNERMKFKTEKQIRSRKCIEMEIQQEHQDMNCQRKNNAQYHSLSEIDEDQIFISHENIL